MPQDDVAFSDHPQTPWQWAVLVFVQVQPHVSLPKAMLLTTSLAAVAKFAGHAAWVVAS